MGGANGAGPRYFSAETRQDLLRVEAAWTANIVNSVIRLGVCYLHYVITTFQAREIYTSLSNRPRLLILKEKYQASRTLRCRIRCGVGLPGQIYSFHVASYDNDASY